MERKPEKITDFLRMLLEKARNIQKNGGLKYAEYAIQQDLVEFGHRESGNGASNDKFSNNLQRNDIGETSADEREGSEELGFRHRGDLGFIHKLQGSNAAYQGLVKPSTSTVGHSVYISPESSTNGVTPDTNASVKPNVSTMNSLGQLQTIPKIPSSGSSSHVLRVPVGSAITMGIFFEVFVFVFILVFLIVQTRRVLRNRREDTEETIEGDVEKVSRNDSSSGVSCSTSTPYQSRRGSVYPGLCSALSENLHCMLPALSPIDCSEHVKRCTFSGSPGIPVDVKPKQIQGSLSEDRERSSTWLDFSPGSRRALYAMTRSRSTPENLAARSSSCSTTCPSVETHIGKIDPSIYRREELAAKFVGKWRQIKDKGKKELRSKLSFKVGYDTEIELLTVFVDSVFNLPQSVKDENKDVFVKIALDPDHKKRSMNSSAKHGSRCPEFKQNFAFRIARGAVSEMIVKLTVCEYDQYSHPIALGRAEYALSEHNFDEEGADLKVIQRDLETPENNDEETMGELMISLTYLPNAERVNLIIMKARNLRLPEWGDKEVGRSILDTFVKITIMRCGKVMKHKNTKVARRSCSPVFNEAFSIDRMRLSEMPECCFVMSVCARLNHFRSHRIIGRCVVGGKDCAVGEGLAHWNEMSDTPRSIVARWHKIQQ